ncbi:aspartate kinase [Schaalia hyovaginalis]|uniref:aspartate kinase n=1 Tax=Schaalia hyovaginalis TaxID=29316 RepID=UPI00139F0D97|nr:aspartate kinase [Schaalia hyovaginalis]MCF2711231.1 aspartate kinase [Schaalia hyovaginalis]MCI6410601.1 aspartate kinase [Schaalia hyovaginalis]MCI6556256.1 aspartate kinase [Schaalia hyovaginalis]MCI7513258.1 aspartate kinase [Schaalia hyovaginalis]MDD7554973.1 aspartate kinase [Schaalia hyovaginalis]
MALIVQKYGGSSVADVEAMKRVARRVADTHDAGHQVVVVVSAMGDTTDDLLDTAAQLTAKAPEREMDILLSAGERISMALLAMAVNELGVQAQAYTGAQAGIRTDSHHGRAQIVGMVPERVARAVKEGQVAIVAGFQGVSEDDDVTTLGRGGSDTTAVALAAALGADVCEIYTDVDGLFSADPRIVPKAHRLRTLTQEETLELAAHGAKILHLRAVEFARRYGVPLHVRSSFSEKNGTWISDSPANPELEGLVPSAALVDPKDLTMEKPLISGIAHDRSQDKITVTNLPNNPGVAARVFSICAQVGANIDMIVQNVPVSDPTLANISFTLPEGDAQRTLEALEAARDEIGFDELRYNPNIGKLSLVGAGMRTNPGVSAKLFAALSDAGINIDLISTSEIRISVVTRLDDLDRAVKAVHSAFGLDATETEAVVYGGTGR